MKQQVRFPQPIDEYYASNVTYATNPPRNLSQLDALKARLEKEHAKALQQLEVRATRAEARSQELHREHTTLRSAASQAERELRES